MAARKTRQPPADFVSRQVETPRDMSETSPLPDGAETVGPARRLWLWPAVVLFAVWFAFLVTLALLTANPVTLNRAQIRRADVVVEAIIEDPKMGRCRVVQTWPAGLFEETISVGGLSASAGETWLLPLARNKDGEGFHVVNAPPPLSKPLIYPADDESRRQLEEILAAEEKTVDPETGDGMEPRRS